MVAKEETEFSARALIDICYAMLGNNNTFM